MKNIGACGGTMGLQAMPTSCGWVVAPRTHRWPRRPHLCRVLRIIAADLRHSTRVSEKTKSREGVDTRMQNRTAIILLPWKDIYREEKKGTCSGVLRSFVCGAPRWWPLLNKYISVNAPVLLRAHHSAHFSDITVFVHSNPLAYPAALTRAPRPSAPRSSARSAPAWPRRLQPRPRTSC